MNFSSTPSRLGLVMFGVMPFVASLKGLMFPANLTLIVPLATALVFAFGSWARSGALLIADIGVLGLATYMALRTLASADLVLQLPLEYGLHAFSLIFLCPFMYYAGRVMAGNLATRNMTRLLWLNAAIAIVFLTITVVAPDFVKRNGIEANSYYQFMGDGLAVAALMAWACGYRPRFYWFYLLTAVLLISIGSRASAVGYLIAMAFSNTRFLLAAGIVGAPAGAWLLSEIERGVGLDWANQFRVLSTFLDFYLQDTEDASYSERQYFFDRAMDVIRDNPLAGQMAYEVRLGEMGEYVHNILHLWANFGVLAIFLMLMIIFGGVINHWVSREKNIGTQPLPLLVFVATEFFFFRHPESIVLFFAMGVLATLYAARIAESSVPYVRSKITAQ